MRRGLNHIIFRLKPLQNSLPRHSCVGRNPSIHNTNICFLIEKLDYRLHGNDGIVDVFRVLQKFQAACHGGQSPRYILSYGEHPLPRHKPKSVGAAARRRVLGIMKFQIKNGLNRNSDRFKILAEAVRFELTEGYQPSTVFKTVALNRSATPPS